MSIFKKKKKQETNEVTLDEVVSALSLDEKISLLSGKDFWRTQEISGVKIGDNTPLNIPSVMVSDGPHGLRKQSDAADNLGVNDAITAVCFPSAAGLASSFDRELLHTVGETLGEECQGENVSTILGPAINIKRSPLCGRNFEYFSEDPYLAGELSAEYIDGVQSKNVGTSLKHFAVNSQERRRLMASSEVDERALREIYLAGFETAVKKGKPKTVMCSYNRINGEYASESHKLLTEILRDTWGFNGVVMSDWGAVHDRAKGVKAGLDLEMPGSYGVGAARIKTALETGEIEEKDIDRCCKNILNWVFKYSQSEHEGEFDRDIHHDKAAEIAEKCMVLLKNDDDILPLKADEKVVFIGDFAKNPRYQGGGSSHINSHRVTNAVDEARKKYEIFYEQGYKADSDKKDKDLFDNAVKMAEVCDKAVIFAGLPENYESEGADREHMRMPDNQNELIRAVCRVQKNVVVVLHNGSPVEMPWEGSVKGILESYLAGEGVGEAQVKILYGEKNPSGHLAETFPIKYSDTPCYSYFPGTFNTTEYRESIFVGYRYYDTFGKNVLFPFGHGLSYTSFEYSALKVTEPNLTAEKNVQFTFTVKNTGSVEGEAKPQIYVAVKNSKVFRAEKELKAFESVCLKPGESKTVSITLSKRAFAYFNTEKNKFVCENGDADILIGESSRDIRLKTSVKVSGFAEVESPYSAEVNEIYRGDVTTLSRAQFESLCGRRIIVDKPHRPFTKDNCIADMVGLTSGDRITKLIDIVTDVLEKAGMGSKSMLYYGAVEAPIRQIVSMTQGMLGEEFADALVDFMNGKKGAVGEIAKSGMKAVPKLLK